MKKINQFFRRSHFFGTIFWLAFSGYIYYAVICSMPIFYIENTTMISVVRVLVSVIGAIVGGVLVNLFLRKPEKNFLFLGLILWIGIIPAISFVVDLIGFDSFYSFGGMMPGLEALGLWIGLIINMAIVIISSVILIVWYILKCKKGNVAEIGVYKEGKLLSKIIDVCNWIIIVGVILFVAYWILVFVTEKFSVWNEKRIESRNEAYAVEYYEKNTEHTEEDLNFKAYNYALICEMIATDDAKSDSFIDELENDLKTEEEEKAYDAIIQGAERLKTLLSEQPLYEGIDTINAHIKYDYQEKKVSFCYEMEIVRNNAAIDYYAIVTFDEEMNVDIRYEEE